MKCSKCLTENLSSSHYCEECGEQLPKKESIANLLDEEITDFVYKPKKKNSEGPNYFMIIFAVVLGLFFTWIILNESPSYENTETTIAPQENPIQYLSLENTSSEWIGYDLHIKGTLKNTNFQSAQNIRVRVDFYYNEDRTGQFDTRYITLEAVAGNGAYTFDKIVYINSPKSKFWWVLTIEDASI